MMTEIDNLIQKGLDINPLREPLLRTLIQALQLSYGSRELDVACGPGLQARLLAEAVRPAGHVTGLDLSAELTRYADALAKKSDLPDRLTFREGNANSLPYARAERPESPGFILDLPDYHACFTYLMFRGNVPKWP
jgi:SAM-dependent methyltransferase